MSRFHHEKLNANFGKYCTRMGKGELGMTAINMGVRMGVGDGQMMGVLIERALLFIIQTGGLQSYMCNPTFSSPRCIIPIKTTVKL